MRAIDPVDPHKDRGGEGEKMRFQPLRLNVSLVALLGQMACGGGGGAAGTDGGGGAADTDGGRTLLDAADAPGAAMVPDWSAPTLSCAFPECVRKLFLRCPLATPTQAIQVDACRTKSHDGGILESAKVEVAYANGVKIAKTPETDFLTTVFASDGSICYAENDKPFQVLNPQGQVVATFSFVGGVGAYADVSCDGATTRVFGECVDLLLTPLAGGYFCSSADGPPTGMSSPVR